MLTTAPIVVLDDYEDVLFEEEHEEIAEDYESVLLQSKLELAQHGRFFLRPAKWQKFISLPRPRTVFKTAIIKTKSGPAVEEAESSLSKMTGTE